MDPTKWCSSCKCFVSTQSFGQNAKTCSPCLSKRREITAAKLDATPPEGQRMCGTCKTFYSESLFEYDAPKTCSSCRKASKARSKRRRQQQKAKLDSPWVGALGDNPVLDIPIEGVAGPVFEDEESRVEGLAEGLAEDWETAVMLDLDEYIMGPAQNVTVAQAGIIHVLPETPGASAEEETPDEVDSLADRLLQTGLTARDSGIEQVTPQDGWLWRPICTSGDRPPALVEHTLTCVGNDVFLIGGHGKGTPTFYNNQTYRLQLSTNCWSKLDVSGDLPEPRGGHAAFSHQDSVFLFGGCTASGVHSNDVFRLIPDEMRWEKLSTTGVGPSGRQSFASAISEGTVFVFGGHCTVNQIQLDDHCVYLLDLSTLRWERIRKSKRSPQCVYNTAADFISHDLVLVSGGSSYHFGTSKYSNLYYIFDIKKQKWSKQKSFPFRPRDSHTLTSIPGTGYTVLFGGFEGDRNSNLLGVFNQETHTWTEVNQATNFFEQIVGLGSMDQQLNLVAADMVPSRAVNPEPRFYHAAVATEKQLYIYGGTFEEVVLGQKQNLGCFDDMFELCAPDCATPGAESMTRNSTQATNSPQQWSTLKAKIDTLFQTEGYAKVLKQCTAAIAGGAYSDDQVAELYIRRAACYLKLDKLIEACADCDDALKRDGTRLSAYVHKAKALLKLSQRVEAEEVVSAGLAIKGACSAEPVRDLQKQLKQLQKLFIEESKSAKLGWQRDSDRADARKAQLAALATEAQTGATYFDSNERTKPDVDWPVEEWSGLEPISIRDFYLNLVHAGRVLAFKVTTAPVRLKSIMFYVKDSHQDTCRIAVYGIDPNISPKQLEVDFGIGSQWVVRNPWFKQAADGDGPILRIDTPSDLCSQKEYTTCTEESTSAQTLNDKAKVAFTNGDFLDALALYEESIATNTASSVLAAKENANCSLICRKLGDSRALAFAEQAVLCDPTWWRGYIRKIEACNVDPGMEHEHVSWFHTAGRLHPQLLKEKAMVELATRLDWFKSDCFLDHFAPRFLNSMIRVGPTHLGNLVDCHTISAAVKLLTPDTGGTIILLPGEYNMGCHLNRGKIDFLAVGEVVVKSTKHHTFGFFGTSNVRLQGLTINQGYQTLDVDSNLTHAIVIHDEACVTLDACSISNACGLCIAVMDHAQLAATSVRISDSYGALVVGDQARVVCNKVEITNMRYGGIEVKGSATLSVTGSKIRNIGRNGVFCHAGVPHLKLHSTELSQTGTLRVGDGLSCHAAIFISTDPEETDLYIELAETVEVTDCKILDNHEHGIYLCGARFRIERSEVLQSSIGSDLCSSVPICGGAIGTFIDCKLGASSNKGKQSIQIMANGPVPIVLRRCDVAGTIYTDDVEPIQENPINTPHVSSSFEDLMRTQLDMSPEANLPPELLKLMEGGLNGLMKEFSSSGLMKEFSSSGLKRSGSSRKDTCGFCGLNSKQLPLAKFMQCGRCKLTSYCSRSCQKQDWTSHRFVCKHNAAIYEAANPDKSSRSSGEAECVNQLCPPDGAAPGEETNANRPQQWSTLKVKIDTLFQTEEYAKVLKQCTAAIAGGAYSDDQVAELYIRRAACYLKLDKLIEACADCDDALKRDGTRLSAYVHKAKALLKLSQRVEAEEVVSAGLAIKGACSAEPVRDLQKQLKQLQKLLIEESAKLGCQGGRNQLLKQLEQLQQKHSRQTKTDGVTGEDKFKLKVALNTIKSVVESVEPEDTSDPSMSKRHAWTGTSAFSVQNLAPLAENSAVARRLLKSRVLSEQGCRALASGGQDCLVVAAQSYAKAYALDDLPIEWPASIWPAATEAFAGLARQEDQPVDVRADALHVHAALLSMSGHMQEALQSCQESLGLKDNHVLHLMKGNLLNTMGDFGLASEALLRAVELGNVEALFVRGCVLQNLGVKTSAHESLKEYIRQAAPEERKVCEAYYHLAALAVTEHDLANGRRLLDQGTKAESSRLRCFIDAPSKWRKMIEKMLGPYHACAHTGCNALGQYKCSKCQLVHYCSRSCQKQDWKQHKVACLDIKPTKVLDKANISTTPDQNKAVSHQSDVTFDTKPEVHNSNDKQFVSACDLGLFDQAKSCLAKGAHVDAKFSDGCPALYLSCQNGHAQIVHLLLQHTADVNLTDTAHMATPLHTAVTHSHQDIFDQLISQHEIQINVQDNNGVTALRDAISPKGLYLVASLLNNAADPNIACKDGSSPLILASEKGFADIVTCLLKHESIILDLTLHECESTALHLASQNGRSISVQYLLMAGADSALLNKDGWSALHIACAGGHVDAVRELVILADVNQCSKEGFTPLELVCLRTQSEDQRNCAEIIIILLKNGANCSFSQKMRSDPTFGDFAELPSNSCITQRSQEAAKMPLQLWARMDTVASEPESTFETSATANSPIADHPYFSAQAPDHQAFVAMVQSGRVVNCEMEHRVELFQRYQDANLDVGHYFLKLAGSDSPHERLDAIQFGATCNLHLSAQVTDRETLHAILSALFCLVAEFSPQLCRYVILQREITELFADFAESFKGADLVFADKTVLQNCSTILGYPWDTVGQCSATTLIMSLCVLLNQTLLPENADSVFDSGFYHALLALVQKNKERENSDLRLPQHNLLSAVLVLGNVCAVGKLAKLYYMSEVYRWVVEVAASTPLQPENTENTTQASPSARHNQSREGKKRSNRRSKQGDSRNQGKHGKAKAKGQGRGKGKAWGKAKDNNQHQGKGKGRISTKKNM